MTLAEAKAETKRQAVQPKPDISQPSWQLGATATPFFGSNVTYSATTSPSNSYTASTVTKIK
jgi:hypothetical protein